jgi:hypothetical protein
MIHSVGNIATVMKVLLAGNLMPQELLKTILDDSTLIFLIVTDIKKMVLPLS